MKLASKIAVTLTLTLSGASVLALQPALAKPKSAPEQTQAPANPAQDYILTPAVREAAAAVQTALKTNDFTTASAKLAEAKAAIATDDDKYIVGSLGYELGSSRQDKALQGQSVDLILSSGKASQHMSSDMIWQLYVEQAQSAYEANQFQKAEAGLEQALKIASPNNIQLYPMLVETKVKLGKTPEAIAVLESAIPKMQAANQTIPEAWLKRGVAIAYNAKLQPETLRLCKQWISAYPSNDSWHTSLSIYRDFNRNLDGDATLDILRLTRAVGALSGESEYLLYAQPLYIGYPIEAESVLKEGIQKGVISASDTTVSKWLATARLKVPAAKADLAKAVVRDSKAATGKEAFIDGTLALGAGDYPLAINLYTIAKGKTGVDAELLSLRLGMAQALAGQKDAAKATLANVTGSRSEIAQLWSIYADKHGA
ncbi:tetratricopeptide repeat protein [Zymomonas mobilis]|uniref:Tetratricopeptide repeat protein n=1 Tax=Zymomonas mobilis subsp. pomaceae (strain ATCC 29192 / DSM 22645 / JCM 10191 / CCUG 17912 / NBRC 13757 / NCIMB 11200 / NRRL B-4491 / Barker I) TaxID=579138 RepID=F8EU07_ZYMMT|nr:hypothetical protein [Zymomonas mobilis]AEI37087.1 hypothetical protein Zymop_0184 [Zymomonas mobilis subsp. pomaceae ATCC 29192]MDX5948458.1 hypothetical protein [Zymomonas mobilis subsp. pomaceae]GEB89477.1 hypothetical protein ZMO02_11140 [Zymomonas mobilis subsp. pomaceae]